MQGHRSFETPRQDRGMSGRGFEDADAHELSEGAPQSSPGAWVPPFRPLGPTTRCRARRQVVHGLVQDDDGGSSDVYGEFHGRDLVLIKRILRDKDYYPSHTEAEEMGLESDESDGEDQYPRKRRRISRSPTGLLRDATASVKRPRRGRPSLTSRSIQST